MKNAKHPKYQQPSVQAPRAVDQMLRIEQVAQILGIGRRTFERMLAAGAFARHDFCIGRAKLWRSSTVQAWIEGESERQGGGAKRVA